jgi:4-diphosphocytidyl-2-C-methyl-D-erythritol kinase
MLCFPNAKINIGLNIIERRPDHYHNIETIFYPIPLTDILEVIKNNNSSGRKVEFINTGMIIPGDMGTNLCVKAYNLLDEDYSLPPVKIHLHKIIPTGAGLGGGSSDGAFTLTLLNQVFELNLSIEQLINYAARLGSDCPFFIINKPSFGTEKGNVLKNIELNLLGHYFVLIKPSVFISTSEAYKGVKPNKPEQSLDTLVKLPVIKWKDKVVNDFESSIFPNNPIIKDIKEELYNAGAIYASMTGSGSALFGIFQAKPNFRSRFEREFYWEEYL